MSNLSVLPSQDLPKSKPKNYIDILDDLYTEREITKQEYDELKKKYEDNLQRY